jgi:hypothetical protein
VPEAIAAKVRAFTPDHQLARVYRMHHEIQDRELRPRAERSGEGVRV